MALDLLAEIAGTRPALLARLARAGSIDAIPGDGGELPFRDMP